MTIILLTFFLFVSPNMGEKKTENVEFYHPTYQDYKFWTEENNLKKFFLEKSFSIKKYYSHNFFKNDNIGYFLNKNLFIPNKYETYIRENFNENMPKRIFFFKDPFFYREKIQYFDVKTPITEIFYINNFFEKEKTLGGFFSQNFNEKINYSIEYRNSNLKNELDLKKSKDLALATFNYQDKKNNYNYKLWGHYIYQKFYIKEKEEFPKWNIRNYENIFFYHKKLIHRRFYINFVKKIYSIQEKNRSLFLKTYMEYEKYSKGHLYQNLQKKINHYYLRNGLFLIFNQKKINIEVGSIFDRIHYQLLNNIFFNKNKNINSLSIQTKVHYPINNVFEFYSNGKWIIENNNIKKSHIQANIVLNTFLISKFRFFTQFRINENNNGIYNNFIPIHVLKNNQDFYKNEQENIFFFNREKVLNFYLSSYEKKYCIFFYISRLNHSYQDDKEIEKFLYRKYIHLYGFKIETTHDIWKFQLNNILLYQKYNSDPLIFSIPNFLYRSTIFYKNNYFHKALFIQTGFSFHYLSKFDHQKIYYPFNFKTFFKEKECIKNKIGGIPFVDYFFNFKIYRTIFYFNIQNIGFYDIYNPNKLFIKTGFLWNLFT
ncbi:putative porin [Blattabacterium cuenoti]|uniref:putative porin n=1 Tax=Blattabacterium cuenoti TaxID=1653831 RepID=UPI00163C92D7|nr:putative porin [Blattabacterium cuenoti]